MTPTYNLSKLFTHHSSITVLMLLMLLSSCDIKKNNQETDPKKDFIKVYENNDFSQSFIPIDVQQTSDGGYVVLAKRRISESQFFGVYTMKADALGEFVSEQKLTADFVNPIGNLMKVNDRFYFFAMNPTLAPVLMNLNEDGTATEVAQISGAFYPLNASLDENTGQFILQHYNRDDRRTVISRINTSGAVTASREFNVGLGDFDVEQPIIYHLMGTGKKLPFLAGGINGGLYFFNGFYNQAFSMVFFTFGAAAPGVVQGYREERCISSALHISGSKFAISRYAYGDNFVSPNATISTSGFSTSSNIPGNLMVEFSPDNEVILKRISVNGRNILVYNSDTKSKQICLYFYEESSGALLGSKHYGFSNPYESANITSTSDGGIALIGTTYVAGRFARIVLIKVNKKELEKF